MAAKSDKTKTASLVVIIVAATLLGVIVGFATGSQGKKTKTVSSAAADVQPLRGLEGVQAATHSELGAVQAGASFLTSFSDLVHMDDKDRTAAAAELGFPSTSSTAAQQIADSAFDARNNFSSQVIYKSVPIAYSTTKAQDGYGVTIYAVALLTDPGTGKVASYWMTHSLDMRWASGHWRVNAWTAVQDTDVTKSGNKNAEAIAASAVHDRLNELKDFAYVPQ